LKQVGSLLVVMEEAQESPQNKLGFFELLPFRSFILKTTLNANYQMFAIRRVKQSDRRRNLLIDVSALTGPVLLTQVALEYFARATLGQGFL
jgi:hypothetical protein